MSWWVYLVTDLEAFKGEDFESVVCEVDIHSEGGTHCASGTDRAEMNITWNYNGFFMQAVHGLEETGLRGLDGQRAGDWIEPLEKAVAELGTGRAEDYWAKTPGNAGYALSILLGWAKQHPDAFFAVH